jgi:hypothetical protein
MVTVPELVEAMIEATKEPSTKVQYAARFLKEAGMLPKSGKGGGKSAALVGPEHAAVLLIGLLATDTLTQVGEQVERIGALISDKLPTGSSELNSDDDPPLQQSFINAVTDVLGRAGTIGFSRETDNVFVYGLGVRRSAGLLEGYIEWESPGSTKRGESHQPDGGPTAAPVAYQTVSRWGGPLPWHGIAREASVGPAELAKIANLFRVEQILTDSNFPM